MFESVLSGFEKILRISKIFVEKTIELGLRQEFQITPMFILALTKADPLIEKRGGKKDTV